MGNQISDFLNQPHNRTLSHRDSLLTKAVTRFMCHGRLFALCYWIQSHLWVHKLHHTFPHMFSALFWNCSFSANMLVSHLAHINFTGFMRHLALSLSSDCFCEKTTMSKSICIILIQSGPIFKHLICSWSIQTSKNEWMRYSEEADVDGSCRLWRGNVNRNDFHPPDHLIKR